LKITFINYDEQSLYEKVYDENDIGKEIHRKLELIDVYSCICDANLEEMEGEKEKEGNIDNVFNDKEKN